jgi:hypothetical protein
LASRHRRSALPGDSCHLLLCARVQKIRVVHVEDAGNFRKKSRVMQRIATFLQNDKVWLLASY